MQKVRMARDRAMTVALELIGRIPVDHVEIVGSLRRYEETVGDVDLIAVSEYPAENLLEVVDGVTGLTGGKDRAFGYFMGMAVNLWTCKENELGAMLFYLTGPAPYVIGYRAKAKRMGMLLNERGLWKDGERVAVVSEADIYTALGKMYKPPRFRGK